VSGQGGGFCPSVSKIQPAFPPHRSTLTIQHLPIPPHSEITNRQSQYSPQISRGNVQKVLLEQQGESGVWPRNEQFEKAWLEKEFYESQSPNRVQWVLLRIEESLRKAKAEVVEIKSPLCIEHVLPQEWIANWPLPNGKNGVRWFERFNRGENQDVVAASTLRDRLKHTIGNLTLLTNPLNTSLSNSSYEAKRVVILNNSALALNRYFQEVQEWDEEAIRARGKVLFEIAKSIWPIGA
jgi:hypothetical protein